MQKTQIGNSPSEKFSNTKQLVDLLVGEKKLMGEKSRFLNRILIHNCCDPDKNIDGGN